MHRERGTNLFGPELSGYKCIEFHGLSWLYAMYIGESAEHQFHLAFKLGLGKSS